MLMVRLIVCPDTNSLRTIKRIFERNQCIMHSQFANIVTFEYINITSKGVNES